MKKFVSITVYTLLFLFSFSLFLVVTFPYEILKEAISAEASKATDLNISIGAMGPALPLGVSFEDVKIGNPGGSDFKLSELEIAIPVLPMLIGRVGARVYMEDSAQGNLELASSLSIADAVAQDFLQQSASVEAENFKIDDIVKFLFQKLGQDFPLLSNDLKKIQLKGGLNSNIQINLDSAELSNSQVMIDLSLKNAILQSVDPKFELPRQSFKKALIRASANQGAVRIDKNSGFTSEGLKLGFAGNINLRSPISRSTLNLKIPLTMKGKLKEMLGQIIEFAFLGSMPWESGDITFELKGTFGNPGFSHKL